MLLADVEHEAQLRLGQSVDDAVVRFLGHIIALDACLRSQLGRRYEAGESKGGHKAQQKTSHIVMALSKACIVSSKFVIQSY